MSYFCVRKSDRRRNGLFPLVFRLFRMGAQAHLSMFLVLWRFDYKANPRIIPEAGSYQVILNFWKRTTDRWPLSIELENEVCVRYVARARLHSTCACSVYRERLQSTVQSAFTEHECFFKINCALDRCIPLPLIDVSRCPLPAHGMRLGYMKYLSGECVHIAMFVTSRKKRSYSDLNSDCFLI
eukprot:jgi/Botrbrau1/10573/Bobra.0343s0021.1